MWVCRETGRKDADASSRKVHAPKYERSGVLGRDRIRNEHIKRSVRVADIKDNMKEHRLRWFDYGMQRDDEELFMAILRLQVGGEVCGAGIGPT